MKFQKRHYEALAEALGKGLAFSSTGSPWDDARGAVYQAVEGMLWEDNPRFNATKFQLAVSDALHRHLAARGRGGA